jgi:hypothetical protein
MVENYSSAAYFSPWIANSAHPANGMNCPLLQRRSASCRMEGLFTALAGAILGENGAACTSDEPLFSVA